MNGPLPFGLSETTLVSGVYFRVVPQVDVNSEFTSL